MTVAEYQTRRADMRRIICAFHRHNILLGREPSAPVTAVDDVSKIDFSKKTTSALCTHKRHRRGSEWMDNIFTAMNTPEAKAAFVFSQSVCAMIEAMAMKAENDRRASRGEAAAYSEAHFLSIIDSNVVHHNAVLKTLA